MDAVVTYIQTTKNSDWVLVHCINDVTGRVAIALCKAGIKIGDCVSIKSTRSSNDGKWVTFARSKGMIGYGSPVEYDKN